VEGRWSAFFEPLPLVGRGWGGSAVTLASAAKLCFATPHPPLRGTFLHKGGRIFGLALLLSLGSAAAAQPIVTSPAPDRLEVTVYRDPDRGEQAMDLGWLNGFALISERRRVMLPAGESVIRFEGVAGGIVPQSAIVTGFPDGIVERNRDAYLLSPATLLDRSLGRRVTLRRTSRGSGTVREQDAVVRSGAQGAIVIETESGLESLRCTGLPETLVYDGVPQGLSAKPTLSVTTRTTQPVEAEVTLSYLATGFDWQANYIAELSDDGRSMNLFAWLTLGSTDETSFPNADTQAVAGNVNYTRAQVPPSEGGPLNLRCWPSATTSDIPLEELERDGFGEENIVVTGSRMRAGAVAPAPPAMEMADAVNMIAVQEALGDLKLYRIPEPVTVAANAQKQVALLVRDDVPVTTVYRIRTGANSTGDITQAQRVLVTRNREQERLGVPLPSGAVAAFVSRAGAPFLIGQGQLDDRAVGEDVEIEIGWSIGVRVRTERVAVNEAQGWSDYLVTVTSDQPRPISFEAEIVLPADTSIAGATLPERDGMRLWAITVPANGNRTLRYRLQQNRARP
jgi:hypothetical protein